jgi:hypothetical protein
VLTPVNNLTRHERKAMCLGAQDSLKARIAEYRALAIVSLMKGISEIVNMAAVEACCSSQIYSVSFPGNGQQGRFHKQMIEIIPTLPRKPISERSG